MLQSFSGAEKMEKIPFDSKYRMIWMFPRNIRIIYPWKLAQIIALLRNKVEGQTWSGNQGLQDVFCKALELAGLKRPGEQYDSHSGGPRTYIAQLKSLGLLFERSTHQLFYTQAGEDLYNGQPPLPILQELLLRYQYPSPYGLVANVRINPAIQIKPFLFVLKMLWHKDIGNMSVTEMMVPVIFGHNSDCFQECIEKVLKFRQNEDITSIIPDYQYNLYTPRTDGNSFSSRLEDVQNIANTMKNWMVAACFLDCEKINGIQRYSISPSVVPLVKKALETERVFLSCDNEESFQRRFGCVRSEKDTRNVSNEPPQKLNTQETIVLGMFYDLIGNQILDAYPEDFVSRMKADFGIPEDVTRKVIAPHLKQSLSFFESTYLELSSGGTPKALDFEKATAKIFSSKLGFTAKHTGQLKRTKKGGYADVFVIEKNGKCCGLIDTKASSCYTLSSSDYSKMLSNYIPNYQELTNGQPLELEFCSYVAGGFKNIASSLAELTSNTGIGASALPASELLRIAQCETAADQQEKIRMTMKKNKVLTLKDFNLT